MPFAQIFNFLVHRRKWHTSSVEAGEGKSTTFVNSWRFHLLVLGQNTSLMLILVTLLCQVHCQMSLIKVPFKFPIRKCRSELKPNTTRSNTRESPSNQTLPTESRIHPRVFCKMTILDIWWKLLVMLWLCHHRYTTNWFGHWCRYYCPSGGCAPLVTAAKNQVSFRNSRRLNN